MDRKHRWDAHPSTLTISRCGVSHYQGTCASDEVVPFPQRVGPWFPTVNIILQGHFLGVSYSFLGQVCHELPCIFGTSSMLQAGEIQGEDGVARAYRPSWNGRCLWHWVKKHQNLQVGVGQSTISPFKSCGFHVFFWFGGAWAIPKVCAPRCSATYECPTELAAVSVPALGVSQRRCLPWWHPTMLVTCRRSHSACFRMWTRSTLGRDQLGPDLVKTMQRMVSFQSGTSELTPWIFLEWQWAKQPIGQAFSNNADNAPIHTVVKFPVSDSHGVSSPCRSNCELSKPPFSRQPRVLTLWWLGRTTKLRLRKQSKQSKQSRVWEFAFPKLAWRVKRGPVGPPHIPGQSPWLCMKFHDIRFNPADMGHFHWRLSTAACFVKQMLSAQAVLLAERPSFRQWWLGMGPRDRAHRAQVGTQAVGLCIHPLSFSDWVRHPFTAWVQHGTAWASASGLLVAPPPKNGSGLLAPEVWVSFSRSYDENVWTTIFTVSCKGAMQWCHTQLARAMQWCHTQLWFEARLSSRMKLSIGWTPLHTSAGRNLSSARNGLSLSQAFRAPLAPRGGPGVPWCSTWEPMARPWTCWIVRVVRLVVKWCEVPKLCSDLNQYLRYIK